jgi:type 1 glutamine amidotransferase
MRNALIVRGGWDGHQPKETSDLFAAFLTNNGFAVTLADTLDAYLDEALMAKQHLIIHNWTAFGPPDKPEAVKRLCATIATGVGFAGWHGGMCDAFRTEWNYHLLSGGQFIAHPPDRRMDYLVTITDRHHPVLAGLDDFMVYNTEQYYMLTDPGNNVLAITTGFVPGTNLGIQPAAPMPVVWTRAYGYGRVFYSALGHSMADFGIRETRTLMERGLL